MAHQQAIAKAEAKKEKANPNKITDADVKAVQKKLDSELTFEFGFG